MNRRLWPVALIAIVVATAAGLFASPSNSAEQPPNCEPLGCAVVLTSIGPAPSTLTMHAGGHVIFYNTDSVTHTVFLENGLCSLTLPAGRGGFQDGRCNAAFFVGSYDYTVDGNLGGTVVATPWRRSVTLKARTHTIRTGTRLTLHGRVNWKSPGPRGTRLFPVIVLARHDSKHPFERIATVPLRWGRTYLNRWNHAVHASETTTYIAKVTGQLPQGQIWANATSRPFTVRVQQ